MYDWLYRVASTFSGHITLDLAPFRCLLVCAFTCMYVIETGQMSNTARLSFPFIYISQNSANAAVLVMLHENNK